jgi:nitroreductase/NAD-dependent dihydropyrimidine dehydrogenase PreA subunit
MSFIVIDKEKCNQDRHCIAECPAQIIKWDEKNNLPVVKDKSEVICLHCGHCVAVCPTKALNLKGMASDACEPVNPELIPSASQTAHLLKARRSIRSYRKKSVPKETLMALIDVARFAPSGHNCQPVKWQVESNADRLHQLTGLVVDWMRHMATEQPDFALQMGMHQIIKAWEQGKDRILRNAPHVVIAHGEATDTSAEPASIIALTYLELAAFSHGLGVCWAGYLKRAAEFWPPMQKMLSLPEGDTVFGAMMVGYPRYSYHRIPLRRPMNITWR